MRKITFLLLIFGFLSVNAQTTHNLNWFTGIGSNVDLTIETGDTVVWTWTSPNHSVENDPSGSSVEVFNSGVLFPNGSTFSHTFTIIGSNDYYCLVHGAASMSGTITVEPALSIPEFADVSKFKINPNPVTSKFELELPSGILEANIEIYNILGKRVYSQIVSTDTSNHDISNWNSGIYLLRVSTEFGSATKRLIKQ